MDDIICETCLYFKKNVCVKDHDVKFAETDASICGDYDNLLSLVEYIGKNLYKVHGESGVYYVDISTGFCTCKGFRIRGKCKHLNQVKEYIKEVENGGDC